MKTSTDTINKMCNESQIILLQEHWLYPDELQLISQLNPNFSGFGISSMLHAQIGFLIFSNL